MIESLLSLPKQVADVTTNLTTLLTRLSATWAAKLDALRTGLTDVRMGYLDKLNVTGNVASAADVAGMMRVKAIYRGGITIPSGQTTGSASIGGTVDPSKCIVAFLGKSGGNSGFSVHSGASITGVTSTTITAGCSEATYSNLGVSWQIVELY